MTDKGDVAPLTPSEDNQETTQESAPAPRAKTPLEMVRERQAKLRGSQQGMRGGSGEVESSGPAASNKRRLYHRKAG